MRKSVQIPRFGGPEVLKLVEQESQPMFSDGVRIQVSAAGVNFADLMMRMGLYPEAPPLPFVPGYEVAGRVTEVGPEVKNFKVGDRVVAATMFGGYTSEIVLAEFQVRRIPDHLSDSEAASIPVNFMTAWVALQEMGRVRKGDRVLIPSAAGGVGIAAVQIASQAGAHVVGLVGSMSKAEAVRGLGAHEVMTNDDWLRAHDSDAGGFDIILDATGGDSLKRDMRRLAGAGRIVSFGMSSIVTGQKRSIVSAVRGLIATPIFTPFKLMMENKGIYGLNMLKFFEPPVAGKKTAVDTSMSRAFDQCMQGFAEKRLRAIVGKEFSFAEAGAGHAHLQSRGNIGKVVLTP